MAVYPVTHVKASTKENVPLYTKVINRNSAPYYMIAELPFFTKYELRFVGLYEDTIDGLKEVPLSFIHLNNCHPYIDITSDGLNLEVGQHDYLIKYVDSFTGDIVLLYFSYIIQDDNPSKPYIYMDKERECLKEDTK